MRKLLFVVLAAIVMISCRKENKINKASNLNITGNWEYRGTTCYCAPPTDTNAYKPGNGTIYSFSGGTYKYSVKHTLQKSGTFKLFKENVNGTELNRIIFDNDYNSEAKYIGLNGNKFSLGGSIGSVADAPVDFYEKL
jgi:hypothetical protein